MQAVLALALAVQAGRLLWIALGPLEGTRASVVATAPADAPAPPPLAARSDAFYPRPTDGAEATGYALLGVRVAGDGGSAILAKGGKQVAYAAGDAVAPGITLAEVASDHVLLRAGGRDHRVALARPAASTLPAPRPLPVGAPPARQAGAGPALDPRRLLTETGLRPQRGDGGAGGYTVVPRGNETLLHQAGLQAGDVLLSVNGRPLDPERLDDLKRELDGPATITFRRGGQTRTLTLQAPQ